MIRQDAVIAERDAASAGAEQWPPAGRAWFGVVLLTAAYFMSYVDRTVLSLLVEPIKQSLRISDTQIGLLQGVAFSLCFTAMSLPAGWLADRGNRPRLIAIGIACWSLMTAICGLSQTFLQLFLARMGVSVGEAALTPTGPSMISDNFPPERRTLPISCFTMAGGMGAGVALIAGGFAAAFVGEHHTIVLPGFGSFAPWQIIFFVVGLPGLLLSLIFLCLPDPRRHAEKQRAASLSELWTVLWQWRAVLVPQILAVCLYQLYAYAFLAWTPAFLMRVHHWSMVEVGLHLGPFQVVSGIAGAATGGLLARRLWRSNGRTANLRAGAIAVASMVIPAVLATAVTSPIASTLLLGLTIACMQATGGVDLAAVHDLIPSSLRGQVTAIYYAIMALSGMTFGPLLIGVMNDHFFSGGASIGRSMSLTALVTLPVSAALLLIAARQRSRFDCVI